MHHTERLNTYQIQEDELSAFISTLRFSIDYFTDWPDQNKKAIHNLIASHIKLVFVESGNCAITVQERTYELSSGDLLLIPPYTLYSVTTVACHTMELFFNVDPIVREQEFLDRTGLQQLSVYHERIKVDVFMRLRQYYDDVRNNIPGSYGILQALLTQILLILARSQRSSDISHTNAKSEQAVVQQIIHYINDHMNNPVTVEELTLALDKSQSYLYRCCKSVMNCSIIQLIQRAKINRAKQLLKDPTLSVSDVAEALGYDPFQFSSLFKKTVRLSPSEYRRQREESIRP